MPYIIPNAIDTTSGNKYSALDQAEPDSIDFEVLGNSNSGVINGCEVTPTTVQGIAVAVSGGSVVVNGVVYSVEPNSYLPLPSPPSSLRFDLVVARVSGTTVSLVCLYGVESATNPALPKSKSRIVSTAGLNTLSYFNPDTDVVLATIYRSASNSITSAEIVDKRRSIQTPIPFRGTTAPLPSAGSVGDFYLQTGSIPIGSSGIYVKRTPTSWVELANIQADPGVPIGTVIQWLAITGTPNPAVWVECNGAYVDPVVMPALFPVINYDFGQESGSTRFKLPDLRGMYLAGLPATGGSLATPVGSAQNSVTLTEANLPQHTHPIAHGHGNITTEPSGDHTHTFTRNYYGDTFDSGGGTPTTSAGPINSSQKYSNWSSVNMRRSGEHNHTFNVPATPLDSGVAGQVSPSPINIQPRTMYVRYYIRYA